MTDIDQFSELFHLEEELLQLTCTPNRIADLLEPGFVEFGASGRVWTREAILSELAFTAPRTYTVQDAVAEMLADGVALLNYRVTVNGVTSLRSSVWRRREGAWRMVFHQGTRVD